MNKIRLLTLGTLICAGGLYAYMQQSNIDPLVSACRLSDPHEIAMDRCMSAYEADHLNDKEKGLLAFKLGYLHGDSGDWEGALAYYNEAITLNPQKVASFHNRGRIRRTNLDDLPGALADFNVYVEMRPNDASGLVHRAETHRRMENFDFAQADLDRAESIAPNDRFLLHTKAELLQDMDDDKGALAVLNGAIDLHPDILSLRRERSWVKRQLEDYEGALLDINHVIINDPDPHWPWYHRGWLNYQLGNYAAALTDLQTAVSKNNTYRPAQRTLSRLSTQASDLFDGDPAGLMAFADTGLVNAPDDFNLMYLRALGQSRQGQHIGAINDINRIIASAPYPHPYIFIRSSFYLRASQFDLALADLMQLTEDPDKYLELAVEIAVEAETLRDQGKHIEMTRLDDIVGQLTALYPKSLRARLLFHQEFEDWPAALEAIDLHIAYDPDDSRHRTTRGEILEHLERPRDAIESYSDAIRLVDTGAVDISNNDISLATALLQRGALYQSQSRSVDAQKDFDRALMIENEDLIRLFQEKMQGAGYYRGPINGIYDQTTKTALQECARDPAC